jgi:peptidylprolyl isomerase
MQAKEGDTVKVHFSSFLDDGTIYESTLDGEPRIIMLGEGNIVPGFDNALLGMKAEETKTVLVEAVDAYDSDHPLAGQYVIFEIKLIEII